jgi:2,3-bisphosphoglycerate-independent phosphoglycerate mutase
MDRDKRWERTGRGYDAIVHGLGEHAPSAHDAVQRGYDRGENDEFIVPTVVDGVDGTVRDGDPIVHANFRADRARQLCHALADPDFSEFDRDAAGPRPRDLFVVTMTAYESSLPVSVAFPPEESRSLAHAASDAGWRQFHVAETEKYAHVTYFFNGGREVPLPGEDRQLVPSPKVANFANPDMVGHTGVWDATVTALATVDTCIAKVVGAVEAVDAADPTGPGSLLLITADHGNAEYMRDASGKPVTAHSLNPVPLVIVGRAVDGRRLHDGVLADVAPTILELAGLPRWDGMTGRSVLEPV